MNRDQLRELLKELDEPFKLEHLERLEDPISLYRHGDWVDLCEGPHVDRLDRPFVFMIVDRPTGAVLFMGRVSDPRKMD